MTEEKIRKQLVEFSNKAYHRGLVGGTGGNFSVRLGQDRMLITPSGISLGDTSLDNLISMDINTYQWKMENDYQPSKEYLFHTEIYKMRPDVKAILHAHPRYTTTFAVKQRDIPMLTDAAFKQVPIPRVPFAPSGTKELQGNVAAAIKNNMDCKVLLLEKHGMVSMGNDIRMAYDMTDLIEELANIAYLFETLN